MTSLYLHNQETMTGKTSFQITGGLSTAINDDFYLGNPSTFSFNLETTYAYQCTLQGVLMLTS